MASCRTRRSRDRTSVRRHPVASERSRILHRRPTIRICGGSPAVPSRDGNRFRAPTRATYCGTWFTYDVDGSPIVAVGYRTQDRGGRVQRATPADHRTGVQRDAVRSCSRSTNNRRKRYVNLCERQRRDPCVHGQQCNAGQADHPPVVGTAGGYGVSLGACKANAHLKK